MTADILVNKKIALADKLYILTVQDRFTPALTKLIEISA